MSKEIEVFKALADENRINILKLVSEKNICAKAISRRLNISEAAVSQHIKVLKEANLIIGYKRGYVIMYQLNKEALSKAMAFIETIKNEKEVVSFKCLNNCKNKMCYCKVNIKEDLKMKICFPVKENIGMESKPYGHFGTAPMFVVCDLENGEVRTINNGDLGHEHGHCSPMKALMGENVDAVVVGGIGQGAIVGLNSNGVKVYRAIEGTLEENISALKNGELNEFAANQACNHHNCSH